jgi:8-oxo-dGTP pyrophosphatase MutT (NUDIX family)
MPRRSVSFPPIRRTKASPVDCDLEVVVRGAASEGLDVGGPPRSHTRRDFLGSHRAILRRVDVPLVEHPPSVVIVAVAGDLLVCVRQTRRGSGGLTLELPSGKLEEGETPAEAAARELAEECALRADGWRELGSFWAVPAYSTELVHVYEATLLAPVDGSQPDLDEDVEVERIALHGAMEHLSDAVSVAALALWVQAA